MINTMVSEILGILLPYILSSAYFYLTKLILILIILPFVTWGLNISNKIKISILTPNMVYSLLFIYMTSRFSIFSLILVEIYGNIGSFIIIYAMTMSTILAIILLLYYGFIEMYHYEFKKPLNFKENFKAYINKNKKFFIIALVLSIISAILTTHFISYIDRFFLFILLISAILSYILFFNQKNIKEILYKLSKDDIDTIILLSSVLSLSFSKAEESIANIFALYSTPYQLVTYIVITITILFLMIVMSLYVYTLNTNRNLENMIKWLILTAFSISLLIVYLSIPSIWYILIVFSSFLLLIFMYLHIHSCILKNINKKDDLDNILGIILTLYALSSAILYPSIDVLYLAIIYVFLTVISLFIYCLKINKEKTYNKQ
jgi:hypothetical protein